MTVGIVGYGNLGRSIEKNLIDNPSFSLIAIFSRREVVSPFGTKVENVNNILDYVGKIDILFLCGGSKSDILRTAFPLAKHFHTIDSFDTHSKIESYRSRLDKQNKENNKCSVISCGWDPGLFSIMRYLITSICGNAYCFWGKGVSQGHTQALSEIDGIENAVQFTCPNKSIIKKISSNKIVSFCPEAAHKRVCYVSTNKKSDKHLINSQIKNMPNYFLGYNTLIHHTTSKRIARLMRNPAHKGVVLSPGEEMKFSLKLKSNPDFTARVLIAYSKALKHMILNQNFGAKTVLDIPISWLIDQSINSYI